MPSVEQVKCLTNGPLAQLAEQRTLNPEVQGSIPWWPTISMTLNCVTHHFLNDSL